MADPRRRARDNAAGPWFVDTTCIACDACRQCAPALFADLADGSSAVMRQPASDDELRGATLAMLACPVGAIGHDHEDGRGGVELRGLFPQELDDGVWYCGFNSRKSYGGNAYLVDLGAAGDEPHDEGARRRLVMIDAPRFVKPVADFIAARGGLAAILLTHGDDVADADRYAERFGAPAFIHDADAYAAPFASTWRGVEPVRALDGAVEVLPVPGHTRGSVMFLARDRLFTGDSLAWSRDDQRLTAFDDACWYSWTEQKRSLARVVGRAFTWVLPGHGQRHKASVEENTASLAALVARM